MHNHMYSEKEQLAMDFNNKDQDFWFMDAYSYEANNFRTDMYSFLHGFCDVFARELSNIYGYKPYVIYGDFTYDTEERTIVHAFCMVNDKYIDIRGITDDIHELLDEFEDFFESYESLKIEELRDDYDERNLKDYEDAACYFINEYYNEYKC